MLNIWDIKSSKSANRIDALESSDTLGKHDSVFQSISLRQAAIMAGRMSQVSAQLTCSILLGQSSN